VEREDSPVVAAQEELEKREDIDRDAYKDFDERLYLQRNPDVASRGLDPLVHFVLYGKAEGRPYPARRDVDLNRQDYVKILKSGYFDPHWYRLAYPDVDGSLPLEHFLEYGVWEGRDPGPNFSTSWYWEQYPDIRGMNPLLHFIDYGAEEGRAAKPPKGAIETAEQTFNSIADIDPALYADERFYHFKGVPIADGRPKRDATKPVLKQLLGEIPDSVTHLIAVPWWIHSGADVVASNIARSAVALLGIERVALVIIDHDRVEAADWLPKNLKIINFAKAASALSEDEKLRTLERLLLIVRPQKLLNVNSRSLWDLTRARGDKISLYCELHACVFCRDYSDRGRPAGYADTHLRDCLGYLSRIYLDNRTFVDELTEQFGFLQTDVEKMIVLKQPVRGASARRRQARHVHNVGLKVLWASRLSKQKNYRLLAEIVNHSPANVTFDIWGAGETQAVDEFQRLLNVGAKVEIRGAYSSFAELAASDYDVYLYTSLWDGIPNALLEAAACELPVVAANVGGISEVVSEDCGWLIDHHDCYQPYIDALLEVMRDRAGARTKATTLAARVSSAHSWKTFSTMLRMPGGFLEDDNAC
jgi:glycosyltransferase involved in cell wall biosynthesis